MIADTPVRSGLMLSQQRRAQSSAAVLLAWQREQFSGQSPSYTCLERMHSEYNGRREKVGVFSSGKCPFEFRQTASVPAAPFETYMPLVACFSVVLSGHDV